jgi:N-acetylglucosaminyldiphosphoundecaprenol N-acetyl-beta-D-mannosaminyltransferase
MLNPVPFEAVSPIPSEGSVRELFSIPIHAMRMEQVLDRIDETIVRRGRLQIGVVNAAKIVNMRRNDLLRRSVLSSDLILADGISVVWASRLLGRPLPERVAGIDLMMEMLRRGNERGYRIYCLGATEEVSDAVTARIRRDFPGVVIAGHRNGYFKDYEEEEVAEDISRSCSDILFVAITSPKKEKFLAEYSAKIGVPICHGVGGSFDVMAGKVERAPEIWQKFGLEWLYRLKQEPTRLWRRYLITNTLFCWILIEEIFRNIFFKIAGSSSKIRIT